MIDPPKTLAEARKYRYNAWGGNPNGNPYREGYCAEEVHEPGRGIQFHQCAHKNGHGPAKLFCRQHDPAAVAARAMASADRFNAEMDRKVKGYDIGALQRAAQLLAKSDPEAAQACRDLAKRMRKAK